MPTTSQGIYYPDSTTNVAPLHTVFSTMATSIDNILAGDVQIHKVANTTARNALVAQFPPSAANPLFVWRADATNGQELEYTKNGTTWHYVNTSEDDTGWVSLSLQNGWSVSFAPQVRRIGKVVQMRGRVTGGTPGTSITTLDSQFRPSQALSFPSRQASGVTVSIFIVNTNGTVVPGGDMTAPNIVASWFVD